MKPSKQSRRSRSRKKKNPPPPTSAAPAAAAGTGAAQDTAAVRQPDEKEEQEPGRGDGESEGGGDETLALNWLREAFASTSLEEVRSAYYEAEGDAYRAAEFLGLAGEEKGAGRGKGVGGGKKQKKVVAATGMVAGVIGRGYGRAGLVADGKRREFEVERRQGGGKGGGCSKEEAEEFLCEMLGEVCELDFGIIRDVFGQCGCNFEMALDELLHMSDSSANSYKQNSHNYNASNTHCAASFQENGGDNQTINNLENCKLMHGTSDAMSYPSGKSCACKQSVDHIYRENANVLGNSQDHMPSFQGTVKQDIQQKVLESLFNIAEDSKHEPSGMNWKKVVKNLEIFGQGLDDSSAARVELQQKATNGKQDSYYTFRNSAMQHWDNMRYFYQRAALAYSKGERAHATYLSEEGKRFRKLAREADELASRDIFEARNKDINNQLTIDLHGQHVDQAMKLLKFHILMLTYSPSIKLLKVITGCGTHGVGRGKVKQSAIGLLEKEGIKWDEENPGTLVIKVDRFREYSFVISDGDSD